MKLNQPGRQDSKRQNSWQLAKRAENYFPTYLRLKRANLPEVSILSKGNLNFCFRGTHTAGMKNRCSGRYAKSTSMRNPTLIL